MDGEKDRYIYWDLIKDMTMGDKLMMYTQNKGKVRSKLIFQGIIFGKQYSFQRFLQHLATSIETINQLCKHYQNF